MKFASSLPCRKKAETKPYPEQNDSSLRSQVLICTAMFYGDRGGRVVKVLRYKSGGRWFDSRCVIGIFH